MFWKKKQNNAIFVDYQTDCKRSSFRYNLPENKPLVMTINDSQTQIANISAFGVGIKNKEYREGEIYKVRFALPGRQHPISTTLTIVYIENSTCHCEFNAISEAEAEAIHQYVFERQMEELRNKSTF